MSITHIRKSDIKIGKQNHIYVPCGRQFIDHYEPHRGYGDAVRKDCLTLYTNGLGVRAIERFKGVHHTTVGNWVKQVGEQLPDTYEPEVGELDELGTFVGSKNQDVAVDRS